MTHLTKNERIQVHHNYILAVSSLEHKKDLIKRLKRSDTCNIPAYEGEMARHMTLHGDIIERVLNILKQDDDAFYCRIYRLLHLSSNSLYKLYRIEL